jgi:hypothetical protein
MSKSRSTSKSRTRKPAAKTTKRRSKASTSRTDSKQTRLIEMLKRPGGTTIDEVVETLDWQPHTVRGAMAGALKKKLGLKIESEKTEERGRVYRIAG